MEIRDGPADCESRDLGAVPLDRESDRRVTEDAEIVGVMGVLPDVFAVENKILPEGLLQAGMKFVAKAGRDGVRRTCVHPQERVQNVIGTPDAGEHQIFVKGRFESSRVGDAKHGVGPLNVVGDAQARLCLAGGG